MRGFTLLEVMIALAIMATVILTVLGSVNYHLDVVNAERDETALTILARGRMAELELGGALPDRSEGTMAPAHPDVTWHAELLATRLPSLRKLVLKVRRAGDRREVTLVRYVVN